MNVSYLKLLKLETIKAMYGTNPFKNITLTELNYAKSQEIISEAEYNYIIGR